jgi:hypothetical protein
MRWKGYINERRYVERGVMLTANAGAALVKRSSFVHNCEQPFCCATAM